MTLFNIGLQNCALSRERLSNEDKMMMSFGLTTRQPMGVICVKMVDILT